MFMNPNFVAPFKVSEDFFKDFKSFKTQVEFQNLFINIKDILTSQEIDKIMQEINNQNWQPVGVSGYKKDYLKDPTQVIGSYRVSLYSEEFAKILWERINQHFVKNKEGNPFGHLDWQGHKTWKAVGVNPLMRFIKYLPNGSLIPHYDSPFVYNEQKSTLMSLVIYLSDGQEGATRFIKDSQDEIPLEDRNFQDWGRKATSEEIKSFKKPKKGEAIAFEHKLLHDSEDLVNETKIILRTDIDFIKV